MNFLLSIVFLVQLALATCQNASTAETPSQTAERVAVKPSDEATWCFIGTVANKPPKEWSCADPIREIFACAFGEARCDGFGYCGTPPCTWRCWCRNGYKRATNGQCVKFCSAVAVKVPAEWVE